MSELYNKDLTKDVQKNLNWIEEELQQLTENQKVFEKTEALKLLENTITTFTVDDSKPFESYTDKDGKIKKIIPVVHKDVKKILWLNVKNPLYSEILKCLAKKQKKIKVSTVGSQANTRYTIVTDEE